MTYIVSTERIWNANAERLLHMGVDEVLIALGDLLNADATFQDLVELEDDVFWEEWTSRIESIEDWVERLQPFVGREEDLPEAYCISAAREDLQLADLDDAAHCLIAAKRLGLRLVRAHHARPQPA